MERAEHGLELVLRNSRTAVEDFDADTIRAAMRLDAQGPDFTITACVICTIIFAVAAVAQTAYAEVPPGPDAINGAFLRLMAHEATTVTALTLAPVTHDAVRMFERWVNRAARDEVSSAEAGLARMLARRHEAPIPLIVHSEPDPVAVMIADALDVQRVGTPTLALGD